MEEIPFFPPATLDGGGNFALIEHQHNNVCSGLVAVVPMALAMLIMSLVAWSDILGAWWLLAFPNSQSGVLKNIERRKGPLFPYRYPGTSVSSGPVFALYGDDTWRNPVMAPLEEAVLTNNRVSSSQLLGVSWYMTRPNSEVSPQKNAIARMEGHRNAAAPTCPLRFALSEDDKSAILVPLAVAALTLNFLTSLQQLGASRHVEHLNSKARIRKKHSARVIVLKDFDPYPRVPLHGCRSSALSTDENKVHRHFLAKVHVALGLLAMRIFALSLILGFYIAGPVLSFFHQVATVVRSHRMRAAPSPWVRKLRTRRR